MKKTFRDRTAKLYDRFMRRDRDAYRQMCALTDPVVRHRQVLELAAGTGLIARISSAPLTISKRQMPPRR